MFARKQSSNYLCDLALWVFILIFFLKNELIINLLLSVRTAGACEAFGLGKIKHISIIQSGTFTDTDYTHFGDLFFYYFARIFSPKCVWRGKSRGQKKKKDGNNERELKVGGQDLTVTRLAWNHWRANHSSFGNLRDHHTWLHSVMCTPRFSLMSRLICPALTSLKS